MTFADALRVIQEAGKKDWRAKEAWLRLSFQPDYRPAGAKVEVNSNAQAGVVVITPEKEARIARAGGKVASPDGF
jgi:hypothetical protein